MTQAHVLPFRRRRRTYPQPAARAASPPQIIPWNIDGATPIDIVAPDRYCADLLQGQAALFFPAEIVLGSPSTVRLHRREGRTGSSEVLGVVERWLASIPLPCTEVVYGDRSYLIRASTGITWPAPVREQHSGPGVEACTSAAHRRSRDEGSLQRR